MNIHGLQIGFNEVPDHISLNIYVAGCLDNKGCKRDKCHNPHLHNFTNGVNYREWYNNLSSLFQRNQSLITAIVLTGGEILDQNFKALKDFILYLRQFNLPIYAYTGYGEQQARTAQAILGFDDICFGHYTENEGHKRWLNKEISSTEKESYHAD